MSDQKRARQFYVSGRVQGVGYRYFAHRAAERLGVTGYVRNRHDGRVEVYAVGTDAQLRAFAAELRRGPEGASVQELSEADAEVNPAMTAEFSIDH